MIKKKRDLSRDAQHTFSPVKSPAPSTTLQAISTSLNECKISSESHTIEPENNNDTFTLNNNVALDELASNNKKPESIDAFKNSFDDALLLQVSQSSKTSKTPTPKRNFSVFSGFEMECLNAHNEYRLKHQVPALKLNKKLCKYAEEWAKLLASRGIMSHRTNSEYGENIFCLWSTNSTGVVSGREPVDNWYNEVNKHVFGKEPTTLRTGHFTQVVWKDSKEIGVGIASNR